MEKSAVATALHFENGIVPAEYETVIESFQRLDDRLRSFPEGSVDLRLFVKERDRPGQHTTLEANIAGQPRLIATSSKEDVHMALAEVRDDMIRQITDGKSRTEPRNNRDLRETL